MSRRVGQNGNVFVKPKCRNGRCNHKKGLCPKYGRYWVDQPGEHERLRKVISLGEVTQTMAERKLRDYIRETQVDSPESFMEVTSPTTTFKQQAQWWLDEMRAGRIVSRRKREPIKPATLAGYEAAVNWLKEIIGETPLADIKNEVAKQLVIKMRAANLSDKTIVNYIHVLQSVIASVVNDEGEQVHTRTWNAHFIGLPVVNPKKQNRPTRTAKEIEKILAAVAGRYRVLYALLAGSGLRIGEALAIRLGPLSDKYSTISDDCSTICIRQAIWRGKEQDPKKGSCSAPQAVSRSHHATSFATVCIPRFSLSSSRGRVSTASGASANPCFRCLTPGIFWWITGWAMRIGRWAPDTRSN